ncbi:hypothetical protein ASPFODRAFT_84770 [Aspergillus luchuensis CBS 106.47]|uniref:Secreted protein n=1 Tax=Aspergillus luchuensis (strain CBS 106.47) TaxID=1137211 RepID=A0A1M3T4Z7_ASPLC|nr:hypothetical protein ASPFODRAFT_84770 [Aspergillus luchuensis CBS 106.47]
MMIPVMIVTWFGISIEACLVCHNILGAIDFGARHSGGASAASFPSEAWWKSRMVFLYSSLRGDWSISRVLGSIGEIRWNSGPWRGHENLFQIPKSLRRT